MDITFGLFCIPILTTICSSFAAILIGLARVSISRSRRTGVKPDDHPLGSVRIFVPVKGISPKIKQALQSLLVQDYPDYEVIFVLEDKSDPAFETIGEFCNKYGHAELFLSGKTTECGQKNFGLAKAVSQLSEDAELLVFCDSTNSADCGWLKRITYPVRAGRVEVCTTFRSFDPGSAGIAGICQALYGVSIFALITIGPKPWGGGTVIRRKTFDRLNVIQRWLKTVVDDLILGNLLDLAKIKIHVSPENFLSSSIDKQSMKGFMSFLDRQILFPKFTNPGIWFLTLTGQVLLALSMALSSIGPVLWVFGNLDAKYAIISGVFWIGMLSIGTLLGIVNKPKLPILKSILGLPVLVCLSTLVCVRSIFIDYIDWHGMRYYCGKGGEVVRIEKIS